MPGMHHTRTHPVTCKTGVANITVQPAHAHRSRLCMLPTARAPSSHRVSVCPDAERALPSEHVVKTLQQAQAFCFDVDSTFCEDESIDELAAFLGMGEQVAALTAKAMGGSVDFRTALSMRLGAMQPTQSAVDSFLEQHPHRISKGIPELVQVLSRHGQKVFLISGGFRQIIHPLAVSLGIPVENVFANTILFDDKGNYAGFDDAEFTSRSGGKATAISHIKAKYGYNTVIMVGDGATDLEARLEGAADLFIGYGGVVVRPNIAAQADWYINDIQQITDVLQMSL